MNNTLHTPVKILSSVCDMEGKLGIYNTFNFFMDLAAEHAAKLGLGYYDMLNKRRFWVVVRTRVRFYERPGMMATVDGETWPAAPSLAKCERFYRLSQGEKVLAEGRSEWAIQDMDTGRVVKSSDCYPAELAFREDRVCEEPFTRFRPLNGEIEEFAYTVGAMDIDTGHHMNNVMYIRMLLSTFAGEELRSMDITEVEISYRRACLEGERLSVRRVFREEAYWFDVVKPDGEIAVQALLRRNER